MHHGWLNSWQHRTTSRLKLPFYWLSAETDHSTKTAFRINRSRSNNSANSYLRRQSLWAAIFFQCGHTFCYGNNRTLWNESLRLEAKLRSQNTKHHLKVTEQHKYSRVAVVWPRNIENLSELLTSKHSSGTFRFLSRNVILWPIKKLKATFPGALSVRWVSPEWSWSDTNGRCATAKGGRGTIIRFLPFKPISKETECLKIFPRTQFIKQSQKIPKSL